MNKEIVFFGCSHSYYNWNEIINIPEYSHINLAESGSSNELILNKIKNWLIENKENYENKILVIQFSYLNRKNIFFDINETEYKLHGINAIFSNYTELSDENKKIISKYYEDWINYFFNLNYEFKKLLVEIEILKKLFDLIGIKYVWYLFDGVNLNELGGIDKKLENTKLDFNLEKFNFIKFENTFFCSEYAEMSKIRNCDIIPESFDTHLHHIGRKMIGNIIKETINKNLI
jgi:hypothetical protein